jgi:Tfp pilus assembly protein PilF
VATNACAHRDRPITGVTPGTAVLVSDVLNQTGDSSVGPGLVDAAVVALQQSGQIRAHDRTRLPAVYRLMKIADSRTPLSYELAQEVAEREGVRFVLGLSVARLGNDYVLGARIADVERQTTVAQLSETFPALDKTIEALDRLLVRTRQVFGESARMMASRRQPLPRVITGSLAALRSYSEGSVAWTHGRHAEARDLWSRAIELDTGFAMAYGALGGYYYVYRDAERGERYFRDALLRSARLTEWEQLRLATSLSNHRGNTDSTLVLMKQFADRFPSVVTFYDYGSNLMRARRPNEAIAALSRALEFDSTYVGAWINLATTYNTMDRHEDAISAYERAARLDSTVLYRGNINIEYGGELVALGRFGDAERVFRKMAEAADLGARQFGHRSLGYLALWQGRIDDAIFEFQQASEAAKQQGEPLSEGRNRLLLSAAYRMLNRLDDANAEITRTLPLTSARVFDPAMTGMVAFELKQLERVRDLDSMVTLIRARAGPENQAHHATSAFASGLQYLARRQPDSAMAAFRRAGRFPWPIQVAVAKAEAFAMLGRSDSALVMLHEVDRTAVFGHEGQLEWMRLPLLRGDLLARTGDTAGAIRAYEAMITRWRGASVPEVATARARLLALRSTP